MFGGGTERGEYLGDLCVWRPEEGWSTPIVESGPSPRTEPALVFAGDELLLFGGVCGSPTAQRYTGEL